MIALSPRQHEVLVGLATGETALGTGHRLFITVDTVKSHRKHLYRKLNAGSGPEAVATAYRAGLLHVPNTKESA